jgi:hypothetical protein
MEKIKLDGIRYSLNLDNFKSFDDLVSYLESKSRLNANSIEILLKKEKINASRFSKKSVKKRKESEERTSENSSNDIKKG